MHVIFTLLFISNHGRLLIYCKLMVIRNNSILSLLSIKTKLNNFIVFFVYKSKTVVLLMGGNVFRSIENMIYFSHTHCRWLNAPYESF